MPDISAIYDTIVRQRLMTYSMAAISPADREPMRAILILSAALLFLYAIPSGQLRHALLLEHNSTISTKYVSRAASPMQGK